MQFLCNATFCVMHIFLRNAKFARANFGYGPSLGYLGAILGPSWAHVGATLGYLGAILGSSWVFLGLLYLYFTARRSQSRFLKLAFCRCEMFVFGILLLWQFPELLLENPWGHLAPSWPILQAPWSHLGPYWAHIGPILGPSWAVLGLPWLSLHKIC